MIPLSVHYAADYDARIWLNERRGDVRLAHSLAPAGKHIIVCSSCSCPDLDSDHDHQRQLTRKYAYARATHCRSINVRPT